MYYKKFFQEYRFQIYTFPFGSNSTKLLGSEFLFKTKKGLIYLQIGFFEILVADTIILESLTRQ